MTNLTAELISAGLSIDQNFPSSRATGAGVVVGFAGEDALAVTLRNVPYSEAYADLRAARSYNILTPDGGMVQFLYFFQRNQITKHRLSFFPSPDLIEYQNASELYEEDERYADIVDKGVVTTPIRFDFDAENFADLVHPMCHLTIGQYKHCRIPVTGPLTPAVFLTFILRSFYNTPFRSFLPDLVVPRNSFAQTITASERGVLHVGVH